MRFTETESDRIDRSILHSLSEFPPDLLQNELREGSNEDDDDGSDRDEEDEEDDELSSADARDRLPELEQQPAPHIQFQVIGDSQDRDDGIVMVQEDAK